MKSLLSYDPPQSAAAFEPTAKESSFLSEAIPVSLWIVYADGHTEFCNDYWARYTGVMTDEPQVGGWAQGIHPEDMELCVRLWQAAIECNEPFEAVLRFKRGSDSQFRHHLCRATPKFDRSHNAVCWYGSTVDIEEQRFLSRAQDGKPFDPRSFHEQTILDRFRESERRQSVVLDNIPGMIYQFEMSLDGSLRFLFVSSGCRELFGLEPKAIENDATLILMMVDPECQPAFYATVTESARNLTRWVWEGWATSPECPSCPRKWIACSSMPALKANGRIVWDGLLMDATTQKLAQIQVEIQRLQLEEANLRLNELNQKLDDLATHDGLTGLKNRRRFQEQLKDEFSRHTRFPGSLSLMMLDVDKFKLFNDTFGHQAGDEVLKAVARVLKQSMREVDFVARYGGEEFVIILPRTDKDAAQMLAERVRSAIEGRSWRDRPITISVGVTTLPNAAGKAPEDLIEAADQALYKSKERGRNIVTFNPCFDGYTGEDAK